MNGWQKVFRVLLSLFILLGWWFSFPVTVRAEVITIRYVVDILDDGLPPEDEYGAPGWLNACTDAPSDCTLRSAIMLVNANAYELAANDPDNTYQFEIVFDNALGCTTDTPCVIAFNPDLAGSGEDLNALGDFDIGARIPNTGEPYPLTLNLMGNPADPASIVLDAYLDDPFPRDRVLDIHPLATVSISDLTLQNGKAGEHTDGGGGVRNRGNLTLRNVAVINNMTSNALSQVPGGFGGGIYNAGTLTLQNVVVSGNTTGKGNGTGNQGGDGGGIYNARGAILAVQGGEISHNTTGTGADGYTSGAGGGLYNDGTASLSNVNFVENSTGNGAPPGGSSGLGGAIFNNAQSILRLESVLFSQNKTGNGAASIDGNGGNGGGGGAIANAGVIDKMDNVTFSYNQTGNGGQSVNFNGGHGGNGGALFNAGAAVIGNEDASPLYVRFKENKTGNGGVAGVGFGGNGGNGGAIYNEGSIISPLIELNPEYPVFEANATGNGGTGGIYGDGGHGGNGGALANTGSIQIPGAPASWVMQNVTFLGNYTGAGSKCDGESVGGNGGSGGAIYNIGNIGILVNVNFESNKTGLGASDTSGNCGGGNGGSGGAIANSGAIQEVRFAGFVRNETRAGGTSVNPGRGGHGGAIFNSGEGRIVVIHSTLDGNKTGAGGTKVGGGIAGSGGNGGAVYAENRSNVSLKNVSITGNQVGGTGKGGGVYNASGLQTRIFVQGSALGYNKLSSQVLNDCQDDSSGNLRSLGYNVVQSIGNCSEFVAPLDRINTDPQLGTLSTGKPYVRIPLTETSPVVDFVPISACAYPYQDQRGSVRPRGWACDAGAVELESNYRIALPLIRRP